MKNTIAVLSVIIFLLSCQGPEQTPLSDEMAGKLALFPQNAGMIAYMNFRQIRASSLNDMFIQSIENGPFYNTEYEEFVTQTGFDFREHMHELFLSAVYHEAHSRPEAFFAAYGAFKPERWESYMLSRDEDQVLTITPYNGYRLLEIDDERIIFCFVDSSLFIGGVRDKVMEYLNRRAETVPELSADLRSRIGNLRYKEGAWMSLVSEPFVKMLDGTRLKNNMPVLENIEYISASMDFTERLQFHGESKSETDENAALIREALEGLIATMKLSVSDDRDIIDILNEIEVEDQDTRVEVSFEMTDEEIRKIIHRSKELSGQSV